MWKNKEIKCEARKALKANYKTLLMMTLVLTFMGVLSNNSLGLANLTTNDGQAPVANTLESYLVAFATDDVNTSRIAHGLMNSFKGTGGVIYSIMHLVDGIITSNGTAAMIACIIAIVVFVLYNIFLKNLLYVGYMRTLLETKIYPRTPFLRIFLFVRKKGAWPIVKAMLLRDLAVTGCALVALGFLILAGAGLTHGKEAALILCIVGLAGFLIAGCFSVYFWYSTILLPFIMSMNNELGARDAMKMSSAMMKGNKKHAAGLDLTFVGWYILSGVTLGLSALFYSVAYRTLTRAEMFRAIRANAIANKIDNYEMLIDEALDSNPDDLDHYPARSRYDEARIVNYVRGMEPNRHYTLINLLLCFFIFSCIGWCWEVGLHIVRDGELVNRGVNWGPWLPIYGVGGVMIIVLLRRFAKKPGILMAATFVLCGVVEYFTSWYLEMTKGMKWWDYSHNFMNLNGRICLEGLLTFAIAGLLFVYIAGPALDNKLNKLDMKVKLPLAIILCAAFGTDLIYSHYHPNAGKGITNGMIDENATGTILDLKI